MGNIIDFKAKKLEKVTKDSSVEDDIEIKFEYAQKCINGIGTDIDVEEGIRCLKEVAEAGHSEAQCILGIHYHNGEILEQDYNKAVELFERAKESNNSRAYVLLAFAYMKGEGGKNKDNNKAFNYFKKAHDLGDCTATYFLGGCYFAGVGVEKNLFHALDFYAKALENGYIYDTKSLLLCLKESISKYQYYEKEILNGNGYEYSNLINIRKKIEVFAKFIDLLAINKIN